MTCRTGTRIVGWAEGHHGLAEYFVSRTDAIIALDEGELSDAEATVIQPLCTVLHQLDRIPDVAGRRVAVIGQGPIGLLFSHALKARGAAWVTGVDRVDRADVAAAFGVDEPVWDDAAAWAAALREQERPELVVEAVGHHAGPLEAAVGALADGGTVLAFGVPDESHYAFPFTAFFRKHATLLAGAATDRAARARERPRLPARAPRPARALRHRRAADRARPGRVRARGQPRRGAAEGRPDRVMAERFTATLQDRHLVVPLDARALWGEARPPVAGTVNGVPFRSRLMVYGGQTVLGLTNAFRAQAQITPGDEVEVVIDRDDAPREVEVPDELRAALDGDETARAAFDALAFTHRREYANWIAEAKRAETRARRAARAIEMLREGTKTPG